MTWQIVTDDSLNALATMKEGSVHTCITSPPYFGLRDYGVERQIGLEATPAEYVSNLVAIFTHVHRVLRDDGTLWIVIGDSYHGGGYSNHRINGEEWLEAHGGDRRRSRQQDRIRANSDLKAKDLIGIPWMLAFALRDAGWYLRQEIVWAKSISGPVYRGGSCMPESVKDRCTRSHETIFMLSKKPRYYFDHDSIKEEAICGRARGTADYQKVPGGGANDGLRHSNYETRNRRSVWHVNPKAFKGAHFATFPPDLIEPMVLAGCPEGGNVLDPFAGSGTTGIVCISHQRNFIGVELNPEYAEIARARLRIAWASSQEHS